MSYEWIYPILLLACSLVPAVLIFLLGRDQQAWRNRINLGGASLKVLVVMGMLWGVYEGEQFSLRLALGGGLELLLHIDALALLFVTLSAGLWLATTVYAIAYLEGDPEQRRFFGFFCLCVSSSAGIALAGNLLTFFIFYELLTLTTLPLVLHLGDEKSLEAGRTYLRYTLAGSALFLFGILWLQALAGSSSFLEPTSGMTLLADEAPGQLVIIFALLIAGLGVKAAIIPLHGWLPAAMVAPAPVSALLHAVAVVKAGAFGIIRVVFDVYGIGLMTQLNLGLPLTIVASITILLGSLIALQQEELKRRLAYSTVSQLSYIVLGASLLSPLGLIGCLVHLVHQGVMKITLFFCAGIYQKELGIHRIDEMDGLGPRMPFTTLAFSACALGMIGLPPMAGFISKWFLGLGGLQAGEGWVILVLIGSSLLNAAYFLPPLYRAWFKYPREPWPTVSRGQPEAKLWLVAPPVFTALVAVAAGAFAAFPISPLEWVRLIIERGYTLQ